MKRSMSELKRKCKRAVETTEKKISETEDLRLELEEANREKSEWQLRYENYVRGIRAWNSRILLSQWISIISFFHVFNYVTQK